MDNKQDRQFYWEVKQFLNNNNPSAIKKSGYGLNEVSKIIMESNRPYRTSNYHQDINSSEVIGQVMNYLGKQNAKKPANSFAHAATVHTNPFTVLKEGIFDTVAANAAKMIATTSLATVPQQGNPPNSSSNPPKSRQLDDGTWVDENGNPIPGSPLPGGGTVPSTPPSSPSSSGGASPTSVPSGMAPMGGVPSTGSTTSPDKTVDDLIDDLYRGRAMPKGDGENRSPEERAEARAARAARNKAISDANIALRRYKDKPESEGGLTRKQREKVDPGSPTNLGGSRVALRYADKAAENALPFEDRPISPFYKMSRNEFRQTYGRDYDASGGANTENMMALRNWKTNLSGKLTRGEEDWQQNRVWDAEQEFMDKNKDLFDRARKGDPVAAAQFLDGIARAQARARKDNPVYDYNLKNFDVPPGPGTSSTGSPYSPKEGDRTMPTNPSKRPLSAADKLSLLGSNPRSAALGLGGCPGGICP